MTPSEKTLAPSAGMSPVANRDYETKEETEALTATGTARKWRRRDVLEKNCLRATGNQLIGRSDGATAVNGPFLAAGLIQNLKPGNFLVPARV